MADLREPCLKSDRSNTVFVKYYAALFWAFFGIGLNRIESMPLRILWAAPFVVIAAFHLSLAVVRLQRESLQYRRFVGWSSVRKNEIMAVGRVWPPFIGYIRFSHYLFPWGRLYFVLDRGGWPWGRGHPLLEALKAGLPARQGVSRVTGVRTQRTKIAAAACAGILLSLFWRLYLTAAVPSGGSGGVSEFINNFPTMLALFLISTVLTVYKRNRPDSWTFAFLAGVSLPYVFFLWPIQH